MTTSTQDNSRRANRRRIAQGATARRNGGRQRSSIMIPKLHLRSKARTNMCPVTSVTRHFAKSAASRCFSTGLFRQHALPVTARQSKEDHKFIRAIVKNAARGNREYFHRIMSRMALIRNARNYRIFLPSPVSKSRKMPERRAEWTLPFLGVSY